MVLKTLLVIIFSGTISIQETDLITIRQLYPQAVEQKETADRLKALLLKKRRTPLVSGYLGAVKIVMAKHAFNPIRKLSYFNNGKNELENSIKQLPAEPELRFLRYAIQVSAPAILNYRSKKAHDRSFLIKWLRSKGIKDEHLKSSIAWFLLEHECPPGEKAFLKQLL
jgi:hypothetical protein